MSVSDENYGDDSFEAIEAAVLKSPKGRWFLDEYGKRLRSQETVSILEAIKRLERAVSGPEAASPEASLKRSQLRYFKEDEEIFVEPKVEAPALALVESAESKPRPEQKGAHLKIERIQASQLGAADVMSPTAPAAKAEPKQRVVIIRRAASEDLAIPMVDKAAG
jgi:hypothetical protein